MAQIAFIGLGNMGGPMATNLVKSGHDVKIFDLVVEAMAQVQKQGGTIASSAIDAARGADFVISMLPAGKYVEALYVGSEEAPGLFSVITKNAVVIDSSTIDSQTAQKVSKIAADQVAAATAGTLAFMCGGSEASFARVKPILECMGKNIFHAGDNGAGQVAKACNNMLLAMLMIGTSEAIKLGADNGLDPAVLSEIMLASSGRNWTLECYNPCPGVMETAPASKGYQPGFMVNLMCKDLNLAMDAARATETDVPMGTLARDLFTGHASDGNGLKDFSSIFELQTSQNKT